MCSSDLGKPCMKNAAFDEVEDEAMAFENMPAKYKKSYHASQPMGSDAVSVGYNGKL